MEEVKAEEFEKLKNDVLNQIMKITDLRPLDLRVIIGFFSDLEGQYFLNCIQSMKKGDGSMAFPGKDFSDKELTPTDAYAKAYMYIKLKANKHFSEQVKNIVEYFK